MSELTIKQNNCKGPAEFAAGNHRVKYETRVVEIGPEVSEFLEHRILVFFRKGAPPELAEFSILHEPKEHFEDVEPGDWIEIGERRYRVTAVGECANANFQSLGHLILKCNGRIEAELPGDVCVEAADLPPVEVGTVIRVIGANRTRD
jgi:PTS system glucitol/sorbitol-specific IIA component